ncbi:MAG: enolase C-terminal domain-like protein [Anaerolineae bacterium]
MAGLITHVEAFEIRIPLPQPLLMGAMHIADREYAFVRIHDDEGNVGTAYGLSRNAPISATVERLIAPRWEKQRLDDHPDLYDRTVRGNVFLGTNGIFWRALSLADCALFDLLARRAGQPLCEYLGGAVSTIPATVAGCYPVATETPETLVEQMHHMASYQPAGIKITSSSDYARDTERLTICRSAIPNGPGLINDVYCGARDAETLLVEARKWESLNMMWVEDPFGFDDYGNLAKLADGLSYPVGVGDEQSGALHFERLIEQGKIRVVRLDATVCGGVRGFMDIAQRVAKYDLPISCHIFHHLHGHLAAAVPNVKWIEYMLPESHVESIQLVWKSDLAWKDGGLALNQTPGTGHDWDEDAIAHYRGIAAH